MAARVVTEPSSACNATEAVLYSFGNPPDGVNPRAGVIAMHGVLYGTTSAGGAHGKGTVFSLDLTTHVERILHSFGSGRDGDTPYSSLTYSGGTLYGTTVFGGMHRAGVVFAVSVASSSEHVVHAFGSGTDGSL